MTRSDTRGRDKRQRLVDGARELVYQQGLERTTLADVAQVADVPPGNVWASVIVVFGKESAVRLSHVAAFAEVAPIGTAASRTARFIILTFILSFRRHALSSVVPDLVGIMIAASHREDNHFCVLAAVVWEAK